MRKLKLQVQMSLDGFIAGPNGEMELNESPWNNTVLAKGDLVDEITHLKQQDGNDIIAYGGAEFVSSLIKHGLIDEFHLFVNPTALGSGMPIFAERNATQNLVVEEARAFSCGIVVLRYRTGQT